MSVQVNWDDYCSQCIYFHISGGWVWRDFETAIDTAHQLSDVSTISHLHYIFDVRNTRVFPRDILYRIRRMTLRLHEKADRMIIVGDGTFADALIQLLARTSADSETTIQQVNTLEEAYLLIGAYAGN